MIRVLPALDANVTSAKALSCSLNSGRVFADGQRAALQFNRIPLQGRNASSFHLSILLSVIR